MADDLTRTVGVFGRQFETRRTMKEQAK